ncbi:Glycine rich protein [Microbacteriaceae bacterium]
MKKWQPNKTVKLLPALALTFGVLAPMPASASIVEECFDNQCTITFGYTGQIEPLTFPPNATNIRFEALGAQGGKSGGGGGRVTGEFTQVPEILYITVGGAGGSNAAEPGGFNGGGAAGGSAGVEGSGGGASDIRIGYSLSSRIVVAGGGGGRGSGLGSGGGAGGGLVGANGKTGQGSGGLGGSQSAGGLGGATYGDGTSGTAGDWGVGGTGGYGPLHGGGGGGGGYYGGGGGGADADSCCTDAGGGGGGSSYTDPSLITNVVHTLGVRPGAGQITFSYQLFVENPPAPPTEETTAPPAEESAAPPAEETTAPPVEEPTTPPTTEEPPTTEPSVPNQPEPESVNSAPSEPEQQVTSQPEPPQAPTQEPAPIEVVLAPEPVEELVAPIVTEEIPSEPEANGFEETRSAPDELVTSQYPVAQDEIVQQPSNLSQAAQSVVVPVQNKQSPWNSNSLFAGLIGLGVFALIAGLVVARRGVPGAIAS